LKIKNISIVLFILTLALSLFGCSGEVSQTSQKTESNKSSDKVGGESTSGGEIQYALNTQPPSMDPHMSTATATRDTARPIFESLVTLNSRYEVVPMLAESWKISEDGKTYTFKLREGVKFHNGKEMKAEDVVASMNRWQGRSATAKTLLDGGTFLAKDEYTVDLTVDKPSIFVLPALAGTLQFAGIMPKEVVEAATETGVKEYIGTGPYKFVEWKQDQYIHYAKFEDYKPLDTPADGLGGKRLALADDLYMQIVTDPSTRLTGLQSGQYDIGYSYEQDMLPIIEGDPNLTAENPNIGYTGLVFNKTEGLMADKKLRQAINAALDNEKIARASLVDNYRTNSSYMQKEQTNWFSEAGSELYNNPDLEKSKQLLAESGYNGEKVRLITSRDYTYMYNSAAVIKEQLAAVGINVELEVYDWPTVVSKRADPKQWELFITGFPTTSTPVEQLFLNSSWVDGPEDDKINGLLQEIRTATSQEDAKVLWDELQGYAWEYLPIIKIADYTTLVGYSNKVEGVTFFDGPVLWNTKVVK
jgi:peptide/nickel transport system substrate-binding protein